MFNKKKSKFRRNSSNFSNSKTENMATVDSENPENLIDETDEITQKNQSLMKDFQAKQKWGQNFLNSSWHKEQIGKQTQAFLQEYSSQNSNKNAGKNMKNTKEILEIGPGLGALTDLILSGMEKLETLEKNKKDTFEEENMEIGENKNSSKNKNKSNKNPTSKNSFNLSCWEIDLQAIKFLERKYEEKLAKDNYDQNLEICHLDAMKIFEEKLKEKLKVELAESLSETKVDKIEKNLKENEKLAKKIADSLKKSHANSHRNSEILPASFALISALPYNIASRILINLAILSPENPFLVIVQKEVGQKCLKFEQVRKMWQFNQEKETFANSLENPENLRAEKSKKIGEKDISEHQKLEQKKLKNELKMLPEFTLFGAFLSLFYEITPVLNLPASAFWPIPKVDSVLLWGRPLGDKIIEKKIENTETKLQNSSQENLPREAQKFLNLSSMERQKILLVLKDLSQYRRKKLSTIFNKNSQKSKKTENLQNNNENSQILNERLDYSNWLFAMKYFGAWNG